jgi:quinoprotein dehydrogenase-associated probable ABC transporter substrate-binding protein
MLVTATGCAHTSPPVAAAGAASQTEALRVCADPNNLPFSNEARAGFENKLAQLLAESLGRRLEYTWWPQRRGFIRNTLDAHACDVVMGVPANYELTLTTRPYYTSTYVFVTREGERRIASFDDPALRRLRIGVHLIGDDSASVPPAQALASRGIVANIRGYSIFGDYATPNPPERLIGAVASGDIDVAIAWGPLAGYFARRESRPLAVTPLPSERDGSPLRFTFDISVGVRRGDRDLRDRIERVLHDQRDAVRRLLREFGVPLVNKG